MTLRELARSVGALVGKSTDEALDVKIRFHSDQDYDLDAVLSVYQGADKDVVEMDICRSEDCT